VPREARLGFDFDRSVSVGSRVFTVLRHGRRFTPDVCSDLCRVFNSLSGVNDWVFCVVPIERVGRARGLRSLQMPRTSTGTGCVAVDFWHWNSVCHSIDALCLKWIEVPF
jgi:hypothetical protein